LNILCTICIRYGSSGVPLKNIRKLSGIPLMAHTIKQALVSGLFEHVVVSTDSSKIAETAKSFGAESWFLRPAEMATDDATKLPVIRHAFQEAEKHYNMKFEALVDLDATSPLRNVEDITAAYQQFLKEDADILISASPSRKNPYYNMVEIINGRIQKVKQLDQRPLRRQDAPQVYDMNASIYIWKPEALFSCDNLITERTSLFIMPEERSVDIDTQLDWDFVEFMINKAGKNND
jgi:CMP-N,N'-diacetyllegionaminic acid synthase